MNSEIIEHLVHARGIDSEYTKPDGTNESVDESTKVSLLNALGYPTDDEHALIDKINQEAEVDWLTVAAPVIVLQENLNAQLSFNLPIDYANDELMLKVTQSEKLVTTSSFIPVDNQLVASVEISDIEIQKYLIDLNIDLAIGYYQYDLVEEGVDEPLGHGVLIVAPNDCYALPQRSLNTQVMNVELLSVPNKSYWGVGDFYDLIPTVDKALSGGIERNSEEANNAQLNCVHVHLIPLNLTNEQAKSYYLNSSSDHWLDAIYIDIEKVEGFTECDEAQTLVNNAFNSASSALQSSDMTLNEIKQLKLNVLKILYRYFLSHHQNNNTAFFKAFEQFKIQRGNGLKSFAIYEAINESLSQSGSETHWLNWPKELQNYESDAVTSYVNENEELVDFYIYVQFIAVKQWQKFQAYCFDRGVYAFSNQRPVLGAKYNGSDVWSNHGLYCEGVHLNQRCNHVEPAEVPYILAPVDPVVLYKQAYQPIIEQFRHYMSSTKVTNIEHITTFIRSWWQLLNEERIEGAYVYYPADDLFAILRLESHLNQCAVFTQEFADTDMSLIEHMKAQNIYFYQLPPINS